MSTPTFYDNASFATTALTTTPVQIAAPATLGAIALLRCVGDAAWLYSNASGGAYVSVPANTTVDIPLRSPHAKLWFKAATTANLVTASFVSGT